MSLLHKQVGSKIPAKINTYMLTRAELLCTVCNEIPCRTILRVLQQEGSRNKKIIVKISAKVQAIFCSTIIYSHSNTYQFLPNSKFAALSVCHLYVHMYLKRDKGKPSFLSYSQKKQADKAANFKLGKKQYVPVMITWAGQKVEFKPLI